MDRARKRRILGMTLILLATGLAWGLYAAGTLTPLERIAYDQRLQYLREGTTAPEDIVLLLVDESSLEAMTPRVGRWPWPRSTWAELLSFLERAEPRAIVFDILFTESEDPGEGKGDLAFARAALRTGRVVQAAQLLDPAADRQPTPLPHHVQERFTLPEEPTIPSGEHAGTEALAPLSALRQRDPGYTEHALPVRALLESARGVGVVSAAPDPDGIFRDLAPVHTYGEHTLPGLAVAALRAAGNEEAAARWRQHPEALDNHGRVPLQFYDDFNAFSVAGALLAQKRLQEGHREGLPIRPEELRDRIVLIGASAVGLHDLKTTPLSARTPGIHLHATLAGNLLEDDILTRAPEAASHAAVVSAALITGLGALLLSSAWLRVLLPLAVIGAWSGWVLARHSLSGEIWELAPPLAGAVMTWVVTLIFLAFTEGRDRRRVRQLLAQYVSPTVLREVVDRREGIASGEVGTTESLTVLFSDVRGFTALSEQLPAPEVVAVLNTHLETMTEEIFATEGTLDKFIGDAIMAFWGAPIRVADHPDRAVATALGMARRMADVNQKIAARGAPPLRIGVGLHTGDATLGHIGSTKKVDYTIIGDTVNLASRMEGLTKHYGCTVLFTEATYQGLSHGTICGIVDRVRVQGRQEPVRIYRPLARHDDHPSHAAQARAWAAASEAAFMYYQARQWDDALAAVEALPEGDPVRRLYSERCQGYRVVPPPPNWDGVHDPGSK